MFLVGVENKKVHFGGPKRENKRGKVEVPIARCATHAANHFASFQVFSIQEEMEGSEGF